MEDFVILLVASARETRAALKPLITASGYEVATIDCDEEINKRMRFRMPSAVIIDCGIPTSFDLIGKIRSDVHSQAVPILMFSSDDQNLRDTALLKVADSYVPKGSLDWAELIAEIRKFAGPPA
jgi:DNA-binding response OmpR family regulator